MCHSLTFHCHESILHPDLSKVSLSYWDSVECAGNPAFGILMYVVRCYDKLPNLRHVFIRYTDWDWDDIVLQAEYGYFQRHVIHLSVHYSFTTPASMQLFETPTILEWVRAGRSCPTKFARIKHLSLSGMPIKFMATLVLLCPHMETLEIAHQSQLAILMPLPAILRSLVLSHPGVAVCRETMASWALDTALNAGLFPKESESKPRIVLRSGTPDPAAFTELKRPCQNFSVELVYERDDSGTHIRATVC